MTTQLLVDGPLIVNGSSQFLQVVELDESPPVVLRRARLEPHGPGLPVYLRPPERQDFAVHPPPRAVGERHKPPELGRKVPTYRDELLALEESLSNVVLHQHRNVGAMQ